MDLVEAIEQRISCRAFDMRPVEEEKLAALKAEVERINEVGGLNFQLYGPREDGSALDMSPGMFAGNPPCYVALVGKTGAEAEEKLGYYGEQLVLVATQLGLGTCWVASTYDTDTVRADVGEGEKLWCVLPVGYAPAKMPLKQRTLRAGLRRRDKKMDAIWHGAIPFAQVPEWVQAGVIAAQKGPSAVNSQPYVFSQESADAPVRAEAVPARTTLENVDLGIAKCHFQVAAEACGKPGHWEWDSGGAYVLD
ncbi:MAG: hypothetical protein IJ131_04025 [Eggerthellaceae bacterium]|nr:hypothetical protein [Eggerthellaceae bacterium]